MACAGLLAVFDYTPTTAKNTYQPNIYIAQQFVKAWKDMPGGLYPVKAEPIVDTITFQQVQKKLKGKDKVKVTMIEELPLKGVLNCHCGRALTGAPSRGKAGKYYYYYKCQVASQHNNISAVYAHDQLQDILHYLSLPAQTVTDVMNVSTDLLEAEMKANKQQVLVKKKELQLLEQRLHSLEQKFIDNTVQVDTYQRFYSDYTQQINYTKAQVEKLSRSENEFFYLLDANLQMLTNLKELFNVASLSDKQQLLNMVFDSKLYYQNRIYRTPYLMEIFHHNTLILKQKQLLILDEKGDFCGKSPQVELQGFEPWSKHIRHKPSTCLSSYYLSAHSRNLANQLCT